MLAIQGQASIQVWTDDSGAFFLLNVREGVFSWTTPTGGSSSGPGTGVRPADGTSVVVDRSAYIATVVGTDFQVGDFLDHVVCADPATGAIVGHYWLNATAEAKLSAAPAAALISPLSPLPVGAATAAAQASALALATPPANIATGQGSVTTMAALLVGARTGRRTVTIENTGTTPVYLGGSGITASNGFLLPGVAGVSLTISFSGALYAVTASGTAAVTFYELY